MYYVHNIKKHLCNASTNPSNVSTQGNDFCEFNSMKFYNKYASSNSNLIKIVEAFYAMHQT